MSFLTPLYLLGLAAISLPILFHLIRRNPRQERVFSSLMFLSPSPPRLTRRSRLDQLILLALRAAILVALAAAFARPLLRWLEQRTPDKRQGRHVALLVDTSASMRRDGVWEQVRRRLTETLDGLEPEDDVALFAFDNRLHPIVDWNDKTSLDHAARQSSVRRAAARLEPAWGRTALGTALAETAETLHAATDQQAARASCQIVLFSDLQRGADVTGLQTAIWPDDVSVAVLEVSPRRPGNASLQLLTDAAEDNAAEPRVRVSNAGDSLREQFTVHWSDATGQTTEGKSVPVLVPPGQSRVVRLARPEAKSDRLVLQGDESPFDNLFFAPIARKASDGVVYIGKDDASDAKGLLYYLQRALAETPLREVTVVAVPPDQPLELARHQPRLVVITEPVTTENRTGLQQYLQGGGTVFVVPASTDVATALADLTGATPQTTTASRAMGEYALLSDLDFSHPVLAALASPRYSDFTKIRFWRHARFADPENAGVRILARFDDGDPALWQQTTGKGRVLVLAGSWRPQDSQLALSSKFVPLLFGILEQGTPHGLSRTDYRVSDLVPLPTLPEGIVAAVTRPDLRVSRISADERQFSGTDQPGIYRLQADQDQQAFAVNIAARESDTMPMDVDQLEQLGVRVGNRPRPSQVAADWRRLRDRELEERQKAWHWLLAAALLLLAGEGWWAIRQAHAVAAREPAAPLLHLQVPEHLENGP